MNRICTLPLILRPYTVQKLQGNSFNRNFSNSSRLLAKTLTLNPQSEFYYQRQTYQNASLFDSRKFHTPPMDTKNAWRRYSTQNKPPNFNSKPASSGNDDDDNHLHEDEELDLEKTDDEFSEYTDDDVELDDHDLDDDEVDEEYLSNLENMKKSVPSTNTVPDYFPKVPMIATAFPVFPKFMKVFEVTDPNLIKLLEWVRSNKMK